MKKEDNILYVCSKCRGPIKKIHFHDCYDFLVKGECEQCGIVSAIMRLISKDKSQSR